jgi:Xaa-Pro aminopeptidase
MVVSSGGSLDLVRMRRERHARLQTEMQRRGVGAALLLTSGNVFYATGAHVVPSDNARTYHQRTIALVVAGDEHPHLFTPYTEGAPPELPADHVHPPLYPELDEGVKDMARRLDELLGGTLAGKLGVDDYTAPMYLGLPALVPFELTNAGSLLTGVRLLKTDDEIECLRRSWAINEAANQAVEAALRPGLRESELTGIFLRALYELGATSNFLDPVFQVMPERIPDAAWSTNGDLPFALVTTDRILRDGDLIWTDTVMGYEQYASDVGRAWIVGARPTARQRELYRRWKDITDGVIDAIRPGATGADLTRIAIEANDGVKPWLDHYFLAHGLGIEGGEIPQIGSDLGQEFDESFVLQPGMAIVVEPITWADGHGGYRAEELVVVTETGYERISDYPDTPFV